MENNDKQLEALHDIRKMMQDSSKFLSLSGLSGIFAGVYGLAGAFAVHCLLQDTKAASEELSPLSELFLYTDLIIKIGSIALLVLAASLLTAYFLSMQKAKKTNQKLFDHSSKKVFWSMAVPLLAGGILCCALIQHYQFNMIIPVMLLFYGMALFGASKHTIPELRFLGLFEMTLGLAAAFVPQVALLLWGLGFGILHIIYGTIMWNKYDRHL